uniref:Uncharacterized protein n=1 Tax=Rhizophagus irregularis (strain DAOM 181602 / DAOM 197198 / MUCL 43194) TaxID=747089 RepID=U9TFE3_RHIID
MELNKIHEFIEDLRPEFVVPVQSAMPQIVHLQIEYSIILQKFMPAKYSCNIAMYVNFTS